MSWLVMLVLVLVLVLGRSGVERRGVEVLWRGRGDSAVGRGGAAIKGLLLASYSRI